jgi:hypothetical protein
VRFFWSEDEKSYDKIKNRLDKVGPTEVSSWANTTLWTIQEGLEQAHGDTAALKQARSNTVALLAALDSLLDRKP